MPRDSGVTSSSSRPLTSPLQHAALNGSADGDALIGVDALERLACPVSFLTASCTAGIRVEPPTIRTLSSVGGLQAGVSQSLADGAHGALDQVSGQLVELGAGQRHIQVLGAGGIGGDEGQVDVGGGGAGQLDLSLLSRFLQTLQQPSYPCAGRCCSRVWKSSAIQLMMRWSKSSPPRWLSPLVARTSGNAVAHLDDGDIEGTAAQVVDHDLLVVLPYRCRRPEKQRSAR